MLQEIICEFSEVSGYKMNTLKSIEFIYIANELLEIKMKKHNLICNNMRNMKYLGHNF